MATSRCKSKKKSTRNVCVFVSKILKVKQNISTLVRRRFVTFAFQGVRKIHSQSYATSISDFFLNNCKNIFLLPSLNIIRLHLFFSSIQKLKLSTFSFNKFCKINLLKFLNFSTLLNSIRQTQQPEQDEIKSAKHQSLVWKLK